ncbi:MAG: YciI family protein [Pseudomonadota bacterium]
MKFAILFEDDDAFADQRAQHMQAHLSFLERNADAIEAAGPLLDGDTNTGAGGLWLIEADSADEARRFVEQDPFWPTGLRKSVRILHWRQVFVAGHRLI